MGLTGAVYFLVAGRWFSAPDFTGPVDVRDADAAGRVQEDSARARALARPRVGAGHARRPPRRFCSRRFRRRRASARRCRRPRSSYQGGTPEFQPIEKTTVQRAVNTDKDIIKVGDLYYMCFQGVWFMSTTATGPWTVTGEVPKQIYEIPVSSPSHSVTYVTVEDDERRRRGLRDGDGVHGDDGRVWLRRVGHRLLLSAVLRVLRRLPVLLPALSDLRVRRVVQPLDRRLHARRGRVRSVRRRRRGAALQPEDRDVLARRGGVRSVRRARRGLGLQPAHRHVRRDPAGLERLRQLGSDGRAARRPLGHHVARDQQRHGHDDAHARRRAGAARRSAAPGRLATRRVGKTGSGDVYAGNDGNVYRKQGDS